MSWRSGVIVVCCLLSGLGCAGSGGPKPRPNRAPRPAAIPDPAAPSASASMPVEPGTLFVNGEKVTVDDVLKPILPALREQAAGLSAEQRRPMLASYCREALVQYIQDLLLYREAAKGVTPRMMEVVDRYVDQELRDRVTREFDGRQSRYEAALAEQGQTIEDAREKERRRLLIIKHLQEHLLPRVADPTRRELLEYYQAHLDEYTQSARRELFMIDVPRSDPPGQARARIEEAQRRLQGGADFATVAREFSEGIHAEDGGAWGFIQSPLQGRYREPSRIFFELGESQVSGIIETADAFFIVKTGEVQEASQQAFVEVQPELVERYRNVQFERLRRDMLQRLLQDAFIEPDEAGFLEELTAAAGQRLDAVASE